MYVRFCACAQRVNHLKVFDIRVDLKDVTKLEFLNSRCLIGFERSLLRKAVSLYAWTSDLIIMFSN